MHDYMQETGRSDPVQTTPRSSTYAQHPAALAPDSRHASFDSQQPRFAAAHFYQNAQDSASQLSVASSLKFASKFPEPPRAHAPKWTKFKIVLFISVISILIYGIAGVIGTTFTWMSLWDRADVIKVADTQILIFTTVASCLCAFTALIGLAGTILNNRAILTAYCFMLWPCFAFIATVGYLSYKRMTFSLAAKLDEQWSRYLDDVGRLIIQNTLHCCGYKTPLHQAVSSNTCYVRTNLPGCKFKFLQFERKALPLTYTIAFSLVPFHIINIIISLLCSNHVNKTFGKGLTPKQYRLNVNDVRGSIYGIWNDISSEMRGAPAPTAGVHTPGTMTPPLGAAIQGNTYGVTSASRNLSTQQLTSPNSAGVRRRYD